MASEADGCSADEGTATPGATRGGQARRRGLHREAVDSDRLLALVNRQPTAPLNDPDGRRSKGFQAADPEASSLRHEIHLRIMNCGCEEITNAEFPLEVLVSDSDFGQVLYLSITVVKILDIYGP